MPDKTDRNIIVVLTLAGSLYYALYYNAGISMSDEGFILDSAYRVLRGQVPYVDFISGYTPGQFYVLAGIFKLFGESVVVGRCLFVAAHLLINVLVYAAARKLVGARFAFLSALLCLLVPSPWHKSFFQLFLILNLLVILGALPGLKSRRIVLAAATAGITFYFRQDLGIFFAAVFIMVLVLSFILPAEGRRDARFFFRRMGGFAAIYFLVLSPFVLTMVFSRRLFEGFLYTYDLTVMFARKIRNPYPLFSDLAPWLNSGGHVHEKAMEAWLFYGDALAVLVIIALFFVRLYRRDNSRLLVAAVLALTSALTLNRVAIRFDFGRMVTLFPVMSLLYVYLLSEGVEAVGRRPGIRPGALKTAAFAVALSCILLFTAVTISHYGFYSGTPGVLREGEVYLPDARAKIYVSRRQAEVIDRVVGYIRANTGPDDRIFVAPMQPMYCFLSDRLGASFLNWFEPGFFDYALKEDDVWAEIRRNGAKVVVIDDLALDGRDERRFSRFAPRLYGLIRENYDFAFSVGTVSVYKSRT